MNGAHNDRNVSQRISYANQNKIVWNDFEVFFFAASSTEFDRKTTS